MAPVTRKKHVRSRIRPKAPRTPATKDEFVRMLDHKIAMGQMTRKEKKEVLVERAHYERQRARIRKTHPHEVVAFSQGHMFTGRTVHEAVETARRAHPGHLAYFEEPGLR